MSFSFERLNRNSPLTSSGRCGVLTCAWDVDHSKSFCWDLRSTPHRNILHSINAALFSSTHAAHRGGEPLSIRMQMFVWSLPRKRAHFRQLCLNAPASPKHTSSCHGNITRPGPPFDATGVCSNWDYTERIACKYVVDGTFRLSFLIHAYFNITSRHPLHARLDYTLIWTCPPRVLLS